MFQTAEKRSGFGATLRTLTLIYHATVREVRKSHRNPILGLAMSIFQAVAFVMAFFAMFSILGMRGAAIRGDFLLYIMSGIFVFLTHTKAMGAVVASEGPASPMMKHRTMNTVIAISAAALSALYLQLLSMAVVLGVYHLAFTPITIYQPLAAFGLLLMGWFSGVAIGMVFLAIKPWAPNFVKVASTLYSRANMIASGKMFVANTLPANVLIMFDWNPLFHVIDQIRGHVFLNYYPHNSDLWYPLWVSLGCLTIGLMGEFYTRKRASISWMATQ